MDNSGLIIKDPNELIQRQSRLLIIDFDVTRYHSYDLFRYLLLDRHFFDDMDDQWLTMLSTIHDGMEQLDYYRSNCSNINPFENFKSYQNSGMTITELDQYINAMLSNPNAKAIDTELSKNLYTVFYRPGISMAWMHYKNDKHKPDFADGNIKFEDVPVDNIFDPDPIVEYIITNQINALLLSSVDYATILSVKLIGRNYKSPMTLMICNYRYNFIEFDFHGHPMRIIKHADILSQLEAGFQYEIGTIDPYSNLTKNRIALQSEQKGGT